MWNKDEIKGKGKKIKGRVKDKVGEIIGDAELEAEGEADRVEISRSVWEVSHGPLFKKYSGNRAGGPSCADQSGANGFSAITVIRLFKQSLVRNVAAELQSQ